MSFFSLLVSSTVPKPVLRIRISPNPDPMLYILNTIKKNILKYFNSDPRTIFGFLQRVETTYIFGLFQDELRDVEEEGAVPGVQVGVYHAVMQIRILDHP